MQCCQQCGILISHFAQENQRFCMARRSAIPADRRPQLRNLVRLVRSAHHGLLRRRRGVHSHMRLLEVSIASSPRSFPVLMRYQSFPVLRQTHLYDLQTVQPVTDRAPVAGCHPELSAAWGATRGLNYTARSSANPLVSFFSQLRSLVPVPVALDRAISGGTRSVLRASMRTARRSPRAHTATPVGLAVVVAAVRRFRMVLSQPVDCPVGDPTQRRCVGPASRGR